MKLPAELPTGAITALIDTREQMPLDLPGLRVKAATLPTGDYSVKGLERQVAIERKSLQDLLACCGRDRERFAREVQRLLAYPVRGLVVESTWNEIDVGQWRGMMTPEQVGGSLVSWMVQGLPVVMAGSHEQAGRLVASILRRAAIHEWRKLRTFAKVIDSDEPNCHDA